MGEKLRCDFMGSLVLIGLPLFFVVITEDAEHPSGEAMVLACFPFRKIFEKSVEICPGSAKNVKYLIINCRG